MSVLSISFAQSIDSCSGLLPRIKLLLVLSGQLRLALNQDIVQPDNGNCGCTFPEAMTISGGYN